MDADEVLVSRGRAALHELHRNAALLARVNREIRSWRRVSEAQAALVRLEAELHAQVAAADDAAGRLRPLAIGRWAA